MGEPKMGENINAFKEESASEKKIETKKENKEEINPEKQRETQIKLLDESIDQATESAQKTKEELSTLRNKMNIASEGGMENASDQYLDDLENKKAKLLEQKEERYSEQNSQEDFDIPEGEASDPKTQKTTMSIEAFEGGANFKQELKKAREEYLQKFIEESMEKVQEDFSQFFNESKNGEEAKELIIKKLESAIEEKGQNFVENGDDPDFGFSAEITGAQFKNLDGTKTQYVTGFEFEFLDAEEIKIEENEAESKGLLSKQKEGELEKAKKQGKLEKLKED